MTADARKAIDRLVMWAANPVECPWGPSDARTLIADHKALEADLEEYAPFVECGGDGNCEHPTTLVDFENTVRCVWCEIAALEDREAALQERLTALCDEALRRNHATYIGLVTDIRAILADTEAKR